MPIIGISKIKQAGMTLIELMVAILLGLLITAAAITAYVQYLNTTTDNVQLMRLNQDMRSIMDLMVRDIRRAGFVTSDPESNFPCLQQNPFNNVNIYASGTGNAGTSCIVFAYNRDNNIPIDCAVAPFNAIEDADRFGFRVSNNALEMKTSGGSEANCSSGTWETISEPDVDFNLTFTLNESELDITEMYADADKVCNAGEACNDCDAGNQCLTVRQVNITMTGTLADGTSQTISEQVRVRNDKYEDSH
jgi:type IV pilus assembly protein PilW